MVCPSQDESSSDIGPDPREWRRRWVGGACERLEKVLVGVGVLEVTSKSDEGDGSPSNEADVMIVSLPETESEDEDDERGRVTDVDWVSGRAVWSTFK